MRCTVWCRRCLLVLHGAARRPTAPTTSAAAHARSAALARAFAATFAFAFAAPVDAIVATASVRIILGSAIPAAATATAATTHVAIVAAIATAAAPDCPHRAGKRTRRTSIPCGYDA